MKSSKTLITFHLLRLLEHRCHEGVTPAWFSSPAHTPCTEHHPWHTVGAQEVFAGWSAGYYC